MATAKLNEQEYQQAIEMTFKHFDKDRDNFLNVSEFKDLYGAISGQLKFPLTDQIIQYLFKQIDTDKDNLVSLKELHSALRIFYYK